MANDEFVDLDEIVPGTGFRKRPEDIPVRKEVRQEIAPSKPAEPKPKEQPKEEEIEEETIDLKSEPAKETSKEQPKPKQEKPKTPPKKEEIVIQKKESKIVPVHKTAEKEKTKEKFQPKKEIKHETKKPIIIQKKTKKEELKAQRRANREESKAKRREGQNTNWTLIALIVFGLIIIGVVLYMIFQFDFAHSEPESVVAVVNGEPIYKSEVAGRLNLLQTTMDPFITQEQVLNLTITDALLLQEAKRQGIRTSDEEVQALLDGIMLENMIDEEALKSDLEEKNVSYDFLIKVYKNTLTINKLMNQSFGNISLSDEEITAFYDANKENMRVPDMVQVRHILVMYAEEAENETYERAEEIFEKIDSDASNFCELVTEYTDDEASIPMCGEYNFTATTRFVPEFLEAGFEMAPGDIKIVKTQIGYHIMYKVADLPGRIPQLSEVEEKLVPILREEKALMELQSLIAQLEDNAIIELYSENMTTKRFKEINASPAQEEPQSEEETTPEPEESETEMQQIVVTKEIVNTPSSQKYILASCLAQGGDRMFTASWSPDSQAQLELFEEYSKNLVIVECDPEVEGAQVELCASELKKQYPTWPTWQIDGNLYEGKLSLELLAKYSGCQYDDQ